MMELNDFMQEFERMCWFYKRDNTCPMGCPMNGVNISQCRKLVFEQPKVCEKIVKDWADNHPKPLTWRQWLGAHDICVRTDGSLEFFSYDSADKPVPQWLMNVEKG